MTVDTKQHLVSPDGNWYWDGVAQTWAPVASHADPRTPNDQRDRRQTASVPRAATRGLSSFVGNVRSEDLVFGQTVLVWARWILIGTGLVLSFWSPTDLLTLQVQLAAIIA